MATPISNPVLQISQIQDAYIRKNFENLDAYFKGQNQLLDFKFFEVIFTAAQTGLKVAHGLAIIPLDILVTQVTGAGKVTFKHGSFDPTYLVLDSTGVCRIRFFAGTYSKQTSAAVAQSTDTEEKQASVSSSYFTGELKVMPTATPATGWLLYTDGTLNIADQPGLYALFGKAYSVSGDATTTFRLPPLCGRTIVIAGSGSGLTPRAMGASGGEETHLLTALESGLPTHTHVDSGHTHALASGPAGGVFPTIGQNNANGAIYGPTASGVAAIQAVAAAPASSSHNTMPPFSSWYAWIKT